MAGTGCISKVRCGKSGGGGLFLRISGRGVLLDSLNPFLISNQIKLIPGTLIQTRPWLLKQRLKCTPDNTLFLSTV